MMLQSKILVVDDTPASLKLVTALLEARGFLVYTANSGKEALKVIQERSPDLVLLDVIMPGMDGYEVCRKIRDNPVDYLPVVLLTSLDPAQERIKGLEVGADDFLTKPVNHAELFARVKSLLRIKQLYNTVQLQAAQLTDWNNTLEERVREQVADLERLGKLKRFFSRPLVDLILSGETEDPLKSHRRDITVVFVDLRGFTSFAETSEPEEIMSLLKEYHAQLGPLISEFDGTLERFTGDGLIVILNDPVPIPNPAENAVRMAIAMRERVAALGKKWIKLDYELGFGVGIASGYATIGTIGFEERWEFTAIGTVTNLAARLCGEARSGQILISPKVYSKIENLADVEAVGPLTLKGFHRTIPAFNVLGLKAN